jgi:hypothetical protein
MEDFVSLLLFTLVVNVQVLWSLILDFTVCLGEQLVFVGLKIPNLYAILSTDGKKDE